MPEGDTVFRTAEKLRTALVGKTLTRCDVRVPRYATVDLTGEVVDEVLSRGKHLFIRVGPASIHSHLKMDGSWLIGRNLRVPEYTVRIILETADAARLASIWACWRFSTANWTWMPSHTSGPICSAMTGRPRPPPRTSSPTRTDRWPRHCWISG